MDLSRFLAKCFGIYFLILTLAMFTNMPQFMQRIDSLIHDSNAMFVTGFFTLILGVMLVVGHNIWEKNWRVIITIIAWLTLLKGVLILYYPSGLSEFSMSIMGSATAAYCSAAFDFALGCILVYCGFRR